MSDRARVLLLSPAIVVVLLYWPVLGFGYVWDDQLILVTVPQFHSDWPTLLHHIFQPFLIGLGYFRPLPLLTLGAEQLLFGGDPRVPHLDALILHATNSCLVATLGAMVSERLAKPPRRALAIGIGAGVVYALHPALIECAAWISVRFDTLMTLFCLLALLADLSIRSRRMRVVTVSLLFLAAALCKEMALGWVLAMPFWHSMFQPNATSWREWRKNHAGNVALYAGIFLAGLAYLVLRVSFQGAVLHPAQHVIAVGTPEHAALVFKTLGMYALLIVTPFTTTGHLHFLPGPVPFTDSQALIGITIIALSCALGWRALRYGPSWPTALPCCVIASLLPVLNIIPLQLGDNFAQDRFLTLPLAFAAIWAALAVHALFEPHPRPAMRRTVGGLLMVFWVALSALIASAMLPGWRDNLSFSLTQYAREPASISGGLDLQQAYLQQGMYQEARTLSEQLRERQGGALYPPQQIGYAYALAQLGEVDAGITSMRQVLDTLPPTAANAEWLQQANVLIGELYLEDGQPGLAAIHLQDALRQLDSADTRYFLALAKMAAGEQAEGERLMDQALADAPENLREARRAEIQGRLDRYRLAAANHGAAGVPPR